MGMYGELAADKRPRTLNSLQQQRYSLNRRLLLAIQTGDQGVRAELEKEIQRNEKLIDEMNCGSAAGRRFG